MCDGKRRMSSPDAAPFGDEHEDDDEDLELDGDEIAFLSQQINEAVLFRDCGASEDDGSDGDNSGEGEVDEGGAEGGDNDAAKALDPPDINAFLLRNASIGSLVGWRRSLRRHRRVRPGV